MDEVLSAHNCSSFFMNRTYYDPKSGSRYTLGRIPIGGTDYSTRPYTYDDVDNDTKLEHFALAKEDHTYKIPYAKKALELNTEVKFFSAAWSAPAWMKTNDKINGYGKFGSTVVQKRLSKTRLRKLLSRTLPTF